MKFFSLSLSLLCFTCCLIFPTHVMCDNETFTPNTRSTFKFPNVEIYKPKDFKSENLLASLEGQKFYSAEHDRVVMTSTAKPNLARPHLGNGLLGTIYRAYSEHVPLILRPDDLWLAIILSFGRYVKAHSEEMRSLFVDHQGRKELRVKAGWQFEGTTERDWEVYVGWMAEEIRNNTKNEVVDWMIPTFSTTTRKDRIVAGVALMSTVNDYFKMVFEFGCGLTEVTLDGTLEDWKQLYKKAEGLYNFGVKELNDWADLLLPVLNEFINAYQGNVKEDFWQRIATSEPRGSGGQKDFRGWFLVFSPFTREGQYQLRPFQDVQQDYIYAIIPDDAICDCSLNVQVLVNDNGEEIHIVFYGGLLMTHYDEENNMLSPAVDWIMIEKKKITFEDLRKSLTEKLKRIESEKKVKMSYKLLKFAYVVAEESLFPNEVLMELVDIIISFNFMASDSNYYEAFLDFLAKPKHYYSPNRLAKYIDPAKKSELLKLRPPTLLQDQVLDL